jgi:hypothetical protein
MLRGNICTHTGPYERRGIVSHDLAFMNLFSTSMAGYSKHQTELFHDMAHILL